MMSWTQCQVCRKECHPLRCSKCKRATYCSVECQKVDWKTGKHRQRCKRPAEENAASALYELLSMAQGLSLNEAVEHYGKSTDEIQRKIQKEGENSNQQQNRSVDTDDRTAIATTKTSFEKSDVTSAVSMSNPIAVVKPKTSENGPFSFEKGFLVSDSLFPSGSLPEGTSVPKEAVDADIFPRFISFVAEEMKYVSQLRILIRERGETMLAKMDPDDFVLSTKRVDGVSTMIKMKRKSSDKAIFEAEIVGVCRAERCSWQVEGNNTIHLRIQLDCDDDIVDRGGSELPRGNLCTDTINGLQCKYCKQRLLQKRSIGRTLELPTGYLEDIADYLICYSGQATVDFSSSSAVVAPEVAMQDCNVVCVHRDDLGSSICVLAVAGYGDLDEEGEEMVGNRNGQEDVKMSLLLSGENPVATVRGDRAWREASGGATVCCSMCCAPLGFASVDSPDSFRLLKHRLVSECDGICMKFSCASFLAREMARYADVKAIFTFVVFREDESSGSSSISSNSSNIGNTLIQRHRRKCILLRLVSWDSRMSTGYEKCSKRLKFRQVAKLVFEETYEKVSSVENSSDVTRWIWGGVDLCCPPSGGMISMDGGKLGEETQSGYDKSISRKVSTVRLQLPADEYDEALETFREGSKLIPKDVSEATIMVKMGVASFSNKNLGMTAVALDL